MFTGGRELWAITGDVGDVIPMFVLLTDTRTNTLKLGFFMIIVVQSMLPVER